MKPLANIGDLVRVPFIRVLPKEHIDDWDRAQNYIDWFNDVVQDRSLEVLARIIEAGEYQYKLKINDAHWDDDNPDHAWYWFPERSIKIEFTT